MHLRTLVFKCSVFSIFILLCISLNSKLVLGQAITTASINGIVLDEYGNGLEGATVIAIHVPSRTQYRTATKEFGIYNITGMRSGGPYLVAVSFVGYELTKKRNIELASGANMRIDFQLIQRPVRVNTVTVNPEEYDIFENSNPAATTIISPIQIKAMPSIKRSIRDLTRLDPRSDGNYSFGGRNWFYNNILLDGTSFNNPFGIAHPAAAGQAGAEFIPFESIEHIQVAVMPFDIQDSGFTGANINTITKSGSDRYKGSVYGFFRNESFFGNTVSGNKVAADPDLAFTYWGFSLSGPLVYDKLYFFMNGELERKRDPGSDFVAKQGVQTFGVSRVEAAIMDSIRTRMQNIYGYDPGEYENYSHRTNNEKLLLKLDWNVNENNSAMIRYLRLDARQDMPVEPSRFSYDGTGRAASAISLPFRKSGYEQNNELNSYTVEVNSSSKNSGNWKNQVLFSYNRFRDFRDPFSEDFPTIEIIEGGKTYTTLGQEPFSIQNELDQDVWQLTNNFTMYSGKHTFTVGGSLEIYSFFNSSNLFQHGVFNLPFEQGGTTFTSLDEFFDATDSTSSNFIDFRKLIGGGPFKSEDIDLGQFSMYGQDSYPVTEKLNLNYGLRLDFPMYFTDLLDNPFSTSLQALDENDKPETIEQNKLPNTKPLFSPRVGISWDVKGDGITFLRSGSGIYTGRLPFVWIGNVISNPGDNPNLPFYLRSFELNAVDKDFKWPQTWNTSVAIDHKFRDDLLGIFEIIFCKDINAVYVRNADLVKPTGKLPVDNRPFFGGEDSSGVKRYKLNPGLGSGIYVLDNTSKGYYFNVSAQLHKKFDFGLNTSLFYSYNQAKSATQFNESSDLFWSENPVKGDPNRPELRNSEFGNRHRIVGMANLSQRWNKSMATHIGLFVEIGQGNRFTGTSGNRYSFTYAGDVNGDGSALNDLIYIPHNSSEIKFDSFVNESGRTISSQQQWVSLNAFIEQDNYLKEHRGKIADRFGLINPYFSSVDLRILHDITFTARENTHTLQINFDIVNLGNLLSSDWGVRKIAAPSATTPLKLVRFDNGLPVFNYIGPSKTFVDDTNLSSRWQIQLGIKYLFN